MTSSDHSRYRGYQLRPQRQWSSWCVGMAAREPLGIADNARVDYGRCHAWTY